MLMNYEKEYVSITLNSVMYASIYKPTKEIKVGLFIPKNHAICLNFKKWHWGTRGSILKEIGFRIVLFLYCFVDILLSLFVIVRLF